MKILDVIPEDKDEILTLFNREKTIWPGGLGLSWYRFWSARGRGEQWRKAVLNNRIVGSVHWNVSLTNARTLYDIVTHPDVRGRGVGRALVDHIGTPIKLKTDQGAPSNLFYQRLGFIEKHTELTRNGKKHVTHYYMERKRGTMELPRIMTYTGRMVNPLDLRPEDICIEDIAHALACCNRFAGQAIKPISVAQHSVYVSRLCQGTPHELQALLHDASEAYLGDITKWVKRSPEMAAFRAVEDRAQAVIFERFGCSSICAPEVEAADTLMVRYEAPRAFGYAWDGFNSPVHDLPLTSEEEARIGRWTHLSWREAEDAFLLHYRHLDRQAQLALRK